MAKGEAQPRETITLRVHPSLKELIRVVCFDQRVKENQLVTDILTAWFYRNFDQDDPILVRNGIVFPPPVADLVPGYQAFIAGGEGPGLVELPQNAEEEAFVRAATAEIAAMVAEEAPVAEVFNLPPAATEPEVFLTHPATPAPVVQTGRAANDIDGYVPLERDINITPGAVKPIIVRLGDDGLPEFPAWPEDMEPEELKPWGMS